MEKGKSKKKPINYIYIGNFRIHADSTCYTLDKIKDGKIVGNSTYYTNLKTLSSAMLEQHMRESISDGEIKTLKGILDELSKIKELIEKEIHVVPKRS